MKKWFVKSLSLCVLIGGWILISMITATFADTSGPKIYQVKINYDLPGISVNQSGYTELRLKRTDAEKYLLKATLDIGAPQLPIDSLVLCLNENETIKEVALTGQTTETIPLEKDVQYIIPPQKCGNVPGDNQGRPNVAIYQSTNLYPGISMKENIIQHFYGYKMALIPIYPIQYNPAGKTLYAATSLTFRIETQIQENSVAPLIKPEKSHAPGIRQLIDNKEVFDNLFAKVGTFFAQSNSVVLADSSAEYLMIGPKAFQASCQGLLNLRINQGFTGTYLAVEDIFSGYSGVDPAEQIRNALRDYHDNHGTKYVLLVGDSNLVPARCLAVETPGDYRTTGKEVFTAAPSDVYYSNLDGTFNYDNDGNWGELNDGDGGGLVDYTPELIIGRIAAGNLREVNRQIYKIMLYELNPQSTQVLEIQGDMGPGRIEFGLLDKVYQDNLNPLGWTASALNDEDTTKPHYTLQDVANQINTNQFEMLFNNQHANPGTLLELWNNDTDIAQLTNTDPFFLWSTGCDPSCFKVFDNDSIGEYLTLKSINASYLFVGHTTSGWTGPSLQFLTDIIKNALKATVSNARREKCIGQGLELTELATLLGNPDAFKSYSVERQLDFNTIILGDPLSPVIKTGFTDLPTNSSILPDVSESANIRITAPAEETVVPQGNSVTIETENKDSSATITSVRFFYQDLKGTAGFQFLGTDYSAPYSYTWNTPASGDYLLRVVGYNGASRVGADNRFIRVAQQIKPVITDIYFPSPITHFKVGQPIFVTAKASDADGWIEGIYYDFNYYNGGTTPLHENWQRMQVEPYTATMSAKQGQGTNTHRIEVTAKAIDNHGFVSNTSTVAKMTLTVEEYNPPTVSINAPANLQQFNINDTVNISVTAADDKNWKDEDGGVGSLNVKVVRQLDGNPQDLGTEWNLGKSATKDFSFNPTVSSNYTITATATDGDGISRQASIIIKVINPNAPLSFENPNKPWSAGSSNVTLSQDTSLKTEGNSSLKLNGTGFMVINSSVFSSSDIDYYSNQLSLDIYLSSPPTNPWWLGAVQLYFSCPSANIYNQYIGQVELTGLKVGQWNTLQLTLPTNIVGLFTGSYSDIQISLAVNTSQAASNPYRIDNLRFTGTLITK